MDVSEAVSSNLQLHDGKVLVVRPPMAWGSDALFVELESDFTLGPQFRAEGFEYVLGVDDIADLVELANSKKMSKKALAELVLHYAALDALPAWFDDIPDHPACSG